LSLLEERRAAFPEFVLGANGGVLSMRIKRLLGCSEAAPSQFGAVTLLAVVLAVVGCYVASIARAQPSDAGTSIRLTAQTGPAEAGIEPTATAQSRWMGMSIHEIDYMGLRSITLSQVDSRFSLEALDLRPATPFDPTKIARATAVLKDMLSEQEHPRATITVVTKEVPPGGVEVLFKIKEGPKATAGDSRSGGAVVAPVSYSVAKVDTVSAAADGGIAGIILDPSGALVPRASVTASNADLHLTMVKTTDDAGRYSLAPLPPGRYNVEVRARGFDRVILPNVKVQPQSQVALNLHLRVGEVNQSLTVASKPLAAALPPPPPQTFDTPASAPVGPIRVSSGTAAGMAISQPPPVYPAAAKAAHVQGVVILKAVISKEGTIENLQVVSGPPLLVTSALDAVKQWRYKPYLLNGEPTAVQSTINVNYTFAPDSADPPSPPAGDSTEPTSPLQSAKVIPWINTGAPVMADGATAPRVIYQVEPEYTPEARQAKTNGAVLVSLKVDEQGKPQDVQVVRGIGKGLDQQAVAAVRQYRFKPAMKDDKPVEEALKIEINFQIF
jgi:TonB family protein